MTNPARKLETEENPSPRRSGMRTKTAAAARIQPEAETLLSFAVTTWAVVGILIALLLAMSGCAGMGPSSEKIPPLSLWPEAALADATESAAARWTAATGIAINVGTGGTPVTFEADIYDPATEKQDCGITQWKKLHGMWHSADFVEIHSGHVKGCPAWETTLLHELGHAVSACDHVPDADDALMSPSMSSAPHWIDAESLALVCETADCTEFNPETSAP